MHVFCFLFNFIIERGFIGLDVCCLFCLRCKVPYLHYELILASDICKVINVTGLSGDM